MKQNETSKVLVGLYEHHNGDLDKIIESIRTKEDISGLANNNQPDNKWLTILDENYPKYLLEGFKPPIAVFYEGNISLLSDNTKTLVVLNGNNTSDYATKSILKIIKEADKIENVVLLVNTFNINDLKELVLNNKKIIMVLSKAIDSKDYEEKYGEVVQLVKDSGGLLLSEMPYGSSESTKRMYVMRFLSLCAERVLVGGVSKHDSLIHAVATSLQRGNDIYCIPFSIGSNYINNGLIKDGAFLIENPDDFRDRPTCEQNQ